MGHSCVSCMGGWVRWVGVVAVGLWDGIIDGISTQQGTPCQIVEGLCTSGLFVIGLLSSSDQLIFTSSEYGPFQSTTKQNKTHQPVCPSKLKRAHL